MADRLATVFPDFTVEVYSGRHHFDPPNRAEPAHVAAALGTMGTSRSPDQPINECLILRTSGVAW
jgi:hypothetical protein